MRLLLASGSPYRRQLMTQLQLPYEWVNPRFDEEPLKAWGLSASDLVERLALEKAKSVLEAHSDKAIIGSDQVVTIGGEILGKPGTPEAAVEQLLKLNGKTHELLTSVVVLAEGEVWQHTESTRMTMDKLSEESLKRYVSKDKPLDCAGSYKIESLGISLFVRVEGSDPSAIQGLPMMALSARLRELGLHTP